MFSFRNFLPSTIHRLASSRRKGKRQLPRGIRPALEVLEDRRLLATINWANTQGGDWGVAGNWDLNRVPTASDDVVINVGSNITITHSSGTDSVNSLYDQQNLSITGGSLTVTNSFTQGANDSLTAQGAAFTANGPATIDHSSLFALSGGTISLPGATSYDGTGSHTEYLQAVDANSTLDLSHITSFKGAGGVSDGTLIHVRAMNGATIDLSQVTEIASGNVGFSAQDANSQIKLTALISFKGAFQLSNYLDVETGGAIYLSTGTTEVTDNVEIDFVSSGTITAGTVQLTGSSILNHGFVTTGTIGAIAANLINDSQVNTVNHADLLTVTGTYTQTSGTLSGPGTVTVNGLLTWAGGTMSGIGVIDANGGLSLSGNATKTLDGSHLNDGGAGTWTGTGDLNIGHGASLSLQSGATLDIQNDQAIKNTLGGIAAVSNAGTLLKSAGTGSTSIQVSFTNTGAIQVQSATLNLTSNFSNFDGANLNGGSYDILGTFQFTGANIVGNAATLILDGPNAHVVDGGGNNALAGFATNTASGSFTIQNGIHLTVNTDFTNAGALTIGAASTFETGVSYTQSGGTTTLSGGTITADSTMIDLQGGVLSGAGALNGTVSNAAEIDLGTATDAGVIIINGDYSQAGGNLVLKIGGLNAGTDYDQLWVNGLAAFAGGALTIQLINGFMPDPSNPDMFRIINFGVHDPMDDFAAYNGTDLGNGLTLVPQYGSNSLTLVATQM
jgi:hypothetical protein